MFLSSRVWGFEHWGFWAYEFHRLHSDFMASWLYKALGKGLSTRNLLNLVGRCIDERLFDKSERSDTVRSTL